MSKLEMYMRPLAIFDAGNKDHRQYYFNFMETGSWIRCPYRWAIPDDIGNLQGMIQRSILSYYMSKEFNNVVKEPQHLVRQKRQKTVDN
jgi:hypothetical protein